jgi:uncharacterized protein
VQIAANLGIVNNPTLVSSVAQAAAFGPMIQGFSVPYALSQILEQGAGQIIVINVFDITKHNTTVAAAPYTMPASGVQAISLGHMGVGNVKVTNVGASVTYINGTHFTLDHPQCSIQTQRASRPPQAFRSNWYRFRRGSCWWRY